MEGTRSPPTGVSPLKVRKVFNFHEISYVFQFSPNSIYMHALGLDDSSKGHYDR